MQKHAINEEGKFESIDDGIDYAAVSHSMGHDQKVHLIIKLSGFDKVCLEMHSICILKPMEAQHGIYTVSMESMEHGIVKVHGDNGRQRTSLNVMQ